VGADGARAAEALRIFDGANISQRRECADPRHGHEQPARRISSNLALHGSVETSNLLAEVSPRLQQRPHDHGDLRLTLDQSVDLAIEPLASSAAGPHSKGLQHPTDHVAEASPHAHELSSRA